MIVCGIDVGARSIKVVILRDSKIISRSINIAGLDLRDDILHTLTDALHRAKLKKDNIDHVSATGLGADAVDFADRRFTVISCAAKGINLFLPDVKTLIDVGAEESRAIRCNQGKVLNFIVNERCAAGAGTFIENISRVLDIPVEQFGNLSLRSKQTISINSQCAVFAESEVVSLIHAKIPKEDIARAVCKSMAERISLISKRISITKPVALIGGMAKNDGFVEALKNILEVDLMIPPEPEFISAIGAALK